MEPTDATQSGREMDARIATRIMGWQQFPYCMPEGIPMGPRGHLKFVFCPPGAPNHISYIAEVPRYSTDLAAAFEVVERLKERDISISLVQSEDGWYAIAPTDIVHDCVKGTDYPSMELIGREGERWEAYETPMLAICACALASLSALEGERK